MTLAEYTSAARERLVGAGIPVPEAQLDARVLAQHVLGWPTARFIAGARDEAPDTFGAAYRASIDRRARREPTAYITGEREFWGLSFSVSPAVLIPRPETELIVESVLSLIPDRSTTITAADVGTGSGCLAVAIATEYAHARIVATDTSRAALDLAARNVSHHGLSARVSMEERDLIAANGEPFALIVSNPPYVPAGERESLQPEVRDYEPASALFAGADGLDVVRRLVAASANRLAPRGFLVFEFGFGQRPAVERLLAGARGLTMTGVRHDLQSIPRVAIVQRD